jgi:hypothetical protein
MTQSIEAKLLSVLVASVLALASYAIVASTVPITVHATTGMSNCTQDPDREDCNPQPDRVGNDNAEVDRDGPGGDDGDPTDDDTGEANCWGKVTSSLTQNDDDQPGIGEHSSDPVPNDDDNETPREGVGNQNEGHPSDHADTVGGLADDVPDCVD